MTSRPKRIASIAIAALAATFLAPAAAPAKQPSAPFVDIHDSAKLDPRTGEVSLKVDIRCAPHPTFFFNETSLQQLLPGTPGASSIGGFSFSPKHPPCDGHRHTLVVLEQSTDADQVPFARGPAHAHIDVIADYADGTEVGLTDDQDVTIR
jgi:hypothetical protein